MNKKLESQISQFIKTRKINVFLLFLGISFGVLILTKLSKTYTETIKFKIDKINFPEENVILNDSTNVLNVTIRTHGFKLLSYYLSKPELKVDFSSKNMLKSDSAYMWIRSKSYANISRQLDKSVELISISPDTLLFWYEVNAVKYVPIKLNSDIRFSPGYDISGELKIVPDSIKIIGPQSKVSKVKIIETEEVSIEEAKSNINQEIALILPDSINDLKFSNKEVILSANIAKFTEGTLKVPVEIINVPENISLRYFPKTVNVSYYTSLDNFSDIEAKDFKVVCDYATLNEGSTFLLPEIIEEPTTIKNSRINQQRIEFIITE